MEKIGKYDIISILGKGAMGIVYKARDPDINREVAIKTIRFDLISEKTEKEDMMKRFMREAQAAGKLQHPHIITVYDVGREADLTYIVMQYIEGQSLQSKIAAHDEYSIGQILTLMDNLCEALDYAHQHGVIHRDIKPANILIDEQGKPYLVDFGVARVETSTLTQTGTTVGTPSYMSPEQVMGKHLDKRSDIFSLGVILYELITGHRPFEGDNITTVIYKIVNEEPANPSELKKNLPAGFEPVILKSLAKNPEDRYSSCQELAADLKALSPLSQKTITLGLSTEELAGMKRPSGRKPALIVGLILAAVIVIGGGGGAYYYLKNKNRMTSTASRELAPSVKGAGQPVQAADTKPNMTGTDINRIKELIDRQDYDGVIRLGEEMLNRGTVDVKVQEYLDLAKKSLEDQKTIAKELAAGIQSYNQGDYDQCKVIMNRILKIDKDNNEARRYLYLADAALAKQDILQIIERQRRAEEGEDLLTLLSDIGSEPFSTQRKEDAVLLFNYYDEIKSVVSNISVDFKDARHAEAKFSHILTALYKKTGQRRVVSEGIKTWLLEKQGNAWKITGLK